MKQELKELLVEAVKDRVEDDKSAVQHQAVRIMSLLDETKDMSIPLLIDTAINGDKRERSEAMLTLIAAGENAIPEIVEKMVNNETDQDARLSGLNILADIYTHDQAKVKREGGGEGGCCEPQDPHGIGPLMRRAVKDVLAETLREVLEPQKEEVE